MPVAFDRHDPRGLGHALTAVLRQRIIDGEITPGQQIPSESELIEEFGVSRSVVRESTASLRAAGLVETFQGRGSVVVGLPGTVPDAGAPAWLSVRGAHDVVAVMDLRLGIEPQAAALAAEHRGAAALAAIRRSFDDFAALAGDRSHLVEADFAFHHRVAVASGNRYIAELLAGLGPRMILVHRAQLTDDASVSDDLDFARLVHEHRAILDAIERSDPDGAAASMRAHLRRSRARIIPPRP